jgi:predicted nucleic acid-binding protein
VIVIDASLAIAWLLQEPELMAAPDVYETLPEQTIVVPSHWPIEVASALQVNVRRGRISLDTFDEITARLAMLQPTVDVAIPLDEVDVLTRFALDQKLTVYDAAYIQLAARYDAPLATLDGDMRASGKRLNLPLLPA